MTHFGVKFDSIYDKYIAVENNNLKNVAVNFGISEEEILNKIPNSIITPQMFTKQELEELKNILKKYEEKFIMKLSSNGKFIVEKNVQLNSLKVNKYSIEINNQRLGALIDNYINELINDEQFNNITNKHKLNIEDLYNNSIKKYLQVKDPQNIIISVYVEKQSTIKTEIIFGEKNAELAVSKDAINLKYDDSNTISKCKIENNYLNNQGNFVFSFENNSAKIELIFDTIKFDNTYNTKIKSLGDNAVIEIKTNFSTNIQVSKLNPSNSVVINDYSEAEMAGLFTEIMSNTTKYITENPESMISKFITSLTGNLNSELYTDIDNQSNEEIIIETNVINTENEIDENTEDISLDYAKTMKNIKEEITTGINDCILNFQEKLETDSNANILEYLTITNIKKFCNGYSIELYNGETFKCVMNDNSAIFYVKFLLSDSSGMVSLDYLEVFSENEFKDFL